MSTAETETKEKMMSRIDARATHIRYLIENPKGRGVRAACTCGTGSPHGAEGWRSFEDAISSGRFDAYIPLWVNDPMVTRICRDYAERGTGIEGLRQALSLKI